MTKEQEVEWERWLSERPQAVREVAERFPPWKEYKVVGIFDTGSRYSPRSYEEHKDGTVTLTCETYNALPIGIRYWVFGINPSDLEDAEEKPRK